MLWGSHEERNRTDLVVLLCLMIVGTILFLLADMIPPDRGVNAYPNGLYYCGHTYATWAEVKDQIDKED